MELSEQFEHDAESVRRQAMSSLFRLFEELCEGTLAVDRDSRIAWISDKYRELLGLAPDLPVLSLPVEHIIPNSRMREVVETGRPIPLDLMQFGDQWFVVIRMPLKDETGRVIGALGFVLYDRVDYLKPLMSQFSRLQSELAAAHRQLAAQRRTKYTFTQIIGGSPAIQQVKRLGRRAAQLDTTLLLLGETGTGKELLAQAIHAASPRQHKPFVAVNVAAVPETLLEAEFFGVAPGAYTGADRKGREGKFQVADGGTLFLDEIGDMPLQVQAKLLRVLQEREIEPIGSNRVIPIDVRIIAATSRDLQDLVERGDFRSDLYYRLNVLPIRTPPLRERLTDLGLICEALLESIATHNGTPLRELDPEALRLLQAHDWPGNIRELRNALERACLLASGMTLTVEHFADILPRGITVSPRGTGNIPPARPLAEILEEVERRTILEALRASRGNKVAAAKRLGLSRSNLYDKLGKLDLMY